jgi:hypothetical protein
MLQNTVPITDCQDVTNAVAWLKENVTSHAVVLTHRAFYGWALSELDPSQVILYEYNDPADVAATLNQDGGMSIYTVWWVNGEGWYGQPTIDASFKVVHESGEIAVYLYQPS